MKLVLRPKEPVFTVRQYDRIANIFDNAGQVVLGIVVIGPIFGEKQSNLPMIFLGVITVATVWTLSILLAKRGDKNGS